MKYNGDSLYLACVRIKIAHVLCNIRQRYLTAMFRAFENELNMANDSACVADFLPNTAYSLCQNSLSLLEICIWQFTAQTPDQGLLVVADVDFFALLAVMVMVVIMVAAMAVIVVVMAALTAVALKILTMIHVYPSQSMIRSRILLEISSLHRYI